MNGLNEEQKIDYILKELVDIILNTDIFILSGRFRKDYKNQKHLARIYVFDLNDSDSIKNIQLEVDFDFKDIVWIIPKSDINSPEEITEIHYNFVNFQTVFEYFSLAFQEKLLYYLDIFKHT